jgi:cytochrome P450
VNAPAASSLRRVEDLPGPRPLPLLGNIPLGRAEDSHLVFESWADRYGDFFGARFGKQRVLGVCDPATVRAVLQDRPDGFRRIHALEGIARESGTLGVFAAEGADWRRQRRLINPSFHASHLDSFYEPIATMTDRLLGVLAGAAARGEVVDVLATAMRYTVDVTSIVAFGRDLDTQRNGSNRLQALCETVMRTTIRRLLSPVAYWRYFSLPRDVAFQRALATLQEILLEIITEARRAPEGAERTGARTLLETMISARDDEEARAPLSDSEVHANVLTLLLAGEDTTAITITWMLYYLARRPDVLARAQAEVDEVLGDATLPSADQVRRLRYVEALALESLRLRGPVPVLFLEAVRDTRIANVEVPARTFVMLFLRHVSKNPALFGLPEALRPERWLGDPPEELLPHSPRHMFAFGAGPRVCPGRGLALLESTLSVATILRSFDPALATGEPPREISSFTVLPSGVKLVFRARAARG